MDRLPPACRNVLDHAAVIGDEFAVDLLAEVLEQPAIEVLALLEVAQGDGLVRPLGPSRFGFTEPLVRAALYASLAATLRASAHERVGLVLEAGRARGRTVDLDDLSWHFLAAAALGTADRAVRYAKEGADRSLQAHAYGAAASLYERALEGLELSPASGDRIQLLLGLAAARTAEGLPSGRDAFAAAGDQARAGQRPEDLAAAALGLAGGAGFEIGLFDDRQIELLEEALLALPEGATSLRAQCAARLSVALSLSGVDDRRAALSDQAVALAREADDPHALVWALAASCDVHSGPADIARRLQEATEILTIARGARDREGELLGRRLRLVALLEDGDLAAADAEVLRFAKVAEALRQPMHSWYVPLWRSLRAATRGDLAAARAFAAEAARIGEAANSPNATVLTLAAEFMCHREAGEATEASAMIDGAVSADLAAEWGLQVIGTFALAHLGRGRREEASALLDRAAEGLDGLPVDSEWVPLLVQLAEAAWELGGHPLAERLYDLLLPFEQTWAVEGIGAFTHGSVARHLGMLAAVLDRPTDASGHFEVALRASLGAEAALLVARTRRDWGLALGDHTRLAEAADSYRALDLPMRVAELEAALAEDPEPPRPPEPVTAGEVFRQEGDVWAVHFGDRTARIRTSKGVLDLVRLLAQPGREIPALDLASGPAPARSIDPGDGDGLGAQGDLGETIDATARAAYKARLLAIDAELDDADAGGDGQASDRLAAERDALLQQLAGAYGLGGRPRRAGDPSERARTAVTARIRDAIKRVEKVHPELGHHLRRSVRTGTFCAYDP